MAVEVVEEGSVLWVVAVVAVVLAVVGVDVLSARGFSGSVTGCNRVVLSPVPYEGAGDGLREMSGLWNQQTEVVGRPDRNGIPRPPR